VSIFNDSSINVSTFRKIAYFADYLHKYTQGLGVNITATDLEVLRDAEEHLDFLDHISGEEAVDWSATIQEGMKKTIEYLQYSRTWYVLFLGALYDQFSGYEVQKSRSRYDASGVCKQIQHFLSGAAKKMKLAELDTLRSLLKKVSNQHLLRIFATIEGADVSERHLHFLQMLLEATLNYPETVMSCKESKLVAEGRYVLMSEVVDKFQSCRPQPIRQVEIFALEKVFIDTNVNLTDRGVHQFTMVAPTWDMIGRIEITLNRATGRQYERPASSGERWSEDGKDGRAGAPGGSAGHFVGIGMHFINSEQLTINTVGGAGGSGQRGGYGHWGEDSKEAEKVNRDVTDNLDNIWPGHKYEQTLMSKPGITLTALYCVHRGERICLPGRGAQPAAKPWREWREWKARGQRRLSRKYRSGELGFT